MSSPSKNHPFHMVEPSPWPFVGSLAALLLGIGGVLFMHYDEFYVLLGGFALLLFTLVGWWRDVIKEAEVPGTHTPEVRRGFKFGMGIFIASEVMFFAAFFWAYFYASLFPTEAIGGVWPPKGIKTLDPFELPYLNTLILLLSGTTVTWAHYDVLAGNIRGMIEKTGYTAILGIIFLCVQAYEYSHVAFSFKDGIYPSTFFMATGFHGFHVLIGTLFLLVSLMRAKKGHFTTDDHFGFEASAWYWHFVDVVWLFLFVSIYWMGS
jgi:heme/copper-type cytochrome/quinol oxidase subunit 3